MKTRLLFSILIFAFVQAKAQLPYSLSTSTQSFQYLSNPTILPWTTSQVISWPFPFYMFSTGKTTATVNVSNDAYINFGGEGIVSLTAGMNMLNSSTQTSYEITGTSPSRILRIEWKNHGFSSTAAPNDSITFQIWMYETSNIIEWHFGPNYWYTGSFGSNFPFVLLANGSNYYNISGTPSNPVFSNCGFSCHLQGVPASGKVYTLIPASASIQESTAPNSVLYPNPTAGKILLHPSGKTHVQVFNLCGDIIHDEIISNACEINISNNPSGVYFVRLISNEGTSTQKIILDH